MKRILFALAFVIGVASCEGCQHNPAPTPVGPTAGDAAQFDGGPATCIDVCRNGTFLGCAFAADTPAGATCLTVCQAYQDAKIAPWDLNCRAAAKTCAAIDACQ